MGKKPENRTSRSVSETDSQLFRDAIEGTRQIRHDKVEPHRKPIVAHKEESLPHPETIVDEMSDDVEVEELETGDELLFSRPGIQHNLLRKLRRGQFPIEAELDLHGLRIEEARTAIAQLLREARHKRWRCVRIIHGKGYGSQSRLPVLKNKVNSWLRQRDEVLAFTSALPADGGTGAVYLLIKR
ncbi:MAG: Smr/MutS family protein [Gammaproteobacteria bacterium]|nr:Smr/MutS family protein [Gammaproteobacteria bacterium]